MSGGAANTTVFFDLGQTLGFECHRADSAQTVTFRVYDDIPPLLAQLRGDGVRLGVLTAGSRWTPSLVQQVLTQSGLLSYFDPALIEHWATACETQFTAAAARAGGPAFFVSPNRRRRLEASLGGLRPVPHPALVRSVVRGSQLIYLRVSGRRLAAARIAALCREEPVAIPLRIAARQHDLMLYVVTTEDVGAAAAGSASATRRRFEATGLGVNSLGDAAQFETSDLCLRRPVTAARVGTGAAPGVLQPAALQPQLVAQEADDTRICILTGGQSSAESSRAGCGGGDVELQPELALLVASRTMGPCSHYQLTTADETDLAALTPELFHEHLVPWWHGLASGVPALPIESRHVEHPHNERAVAQATQYLADSCGGENVRRCPFDGPFDKPLDNIEAEIPPDPHSPYREEVVILGAHLDSIDWEHEQHSQQAAPGVDDDASGIAGVLSAARVLATMSQRQRPRRMIRFVLFNAEEIILSGSRRYVADRQGIDHVVAMFQLDMIGYVTDYPPAQCEVHTGIGRPFDNPQKLRELRERSAQLGEIVEHAARAVSPSLVIQRYPTGLHCGDGGSSDSDHAPFYGAGCPACKVCEDFYFDSCEGDRRRGHPTYHSRRDTEINVAYATDIARAVAAAVWMRANAT